MACETGYNVNLFEIDSMGIVHHSNYPKWLEAGRSDFLKKSGISSQNGLYLPLLKMECAFKSAAKFGDKLIIVTKLVYMTQYKLKFEYRILNKLNGKLLATGKTAHIWTDKKLNPINLEKTSPDIYRQLKQMLETADEKD